MKLEGLQRRQFYEALLDAFDLNGLTRMVSFELNESLNLIAGGSSTSDIVFNLIQWAERTNRTKDLLQGALAENPNNHLLNKFAQEVGFLESPVSSNKEDSATDPRKRDEIFGVLSSIPAPQFERVLFSINPTSGTVPGSASPQAQRVAALLEWAESPMGCGLRSVEDVIQSILRS
jgi:hypothetical protein